MRALFGQVAPVCVCVALAIAGLHATGQAPRRTPPAPRTAPPTAPRGAAAPARPRTDAAVPFKVGETLTYDVAWSQFLVAGTAVTRVVEKRTANNSAAYYVVAEGKPLPLIARLYALYYKMDAFVDSVTTLSQRTSLYREEGTRKWSVGTTFNRTTKKAQYRSYSEPAQTSEFAVPTDVQDGLSALYALRARAFKTGDRIRVPVTDEGSLYTVTFDVGAPETLKVPLGQVNAWNLHVTIRDGADQTIGQNIAAWISTDPRRLPVKIQADLPVGNFILALRTAQ